MSLKLTIEVSKEKEGIIQNCLEHMSREVFSKSKGLSDSCYKKLGAGKFILDIDYFGQNFLLDKLFIMELKKAVKAIDKNGKVEKAK